MHAIGRYAKHERALRRSRFGVDKAYFEKLEDSKVFGPTFQLELLCSAEFSWNKVHRTKRALGSSGLQEVGCNINQT